MENGREKGRSGTYLLIVACILLTKVLGMARNIFLSAYYGTGDAAAVFQAISKLPLTLYDVTLGTAIVSAFIPVFNERLQKDGKKAANRFGSNFLGFAGILSVLICAAGMIFPRAYVKIVAAGFNKAQMALAVPMMRWILPIILFATVAYIFIGILQSYGEFTAPALVSLFTNLTIIVYFLFFDRFFGIGGLAVAFTLGWSFQLLFLLPFIIRRGFRYTPVLSFGDKDLTRALVLSLPLFVSSLAQPINTLISNNLSSGLPDSALSTLNYAYDTYFILAAVFAAAMTNLYFPELSRRFAAGDGKGAADIGRQMLKTVAAIVLPITAFMAVCGAPVIRLLYQRGEFTAENTAAVAACLTVYCIGMLALSFQEILNKFYYSMQKPWLPMLAALAGIALNIVLSLVFVKVFGRYRLLAWATVISGWCMAGMLLLFALKKARGLLARDLWISLGKTSLAALALAGAAYGTYKGLSVPLGASFAGTGLATLGALLIGAGAYFAVLKLVRSAELDEILKTVKRKKKGAAS